LSLEITDARALFNTAFTPGAARELDAPLALGYFLAWEWGVQ
jgi:hypothetical protein